ncbi:MAG: hypothetical protein WCW68_13020 [Methanothrix sp.]
MNTEYLTAFRTSPPFFFVSDEMPYAEFSNILEIPDHAHVIPGSIPLIQMVQPDARKIVTKEAILDFGIHIFSQFLIRHATQDSIKAVVTSATG